MKLSEFLGNSNKGDIFFIKDGKGVGDCDIYNKWEIVEIEEFHTTNRNWHDITIYKSRILKLLNKAHGLITYACNFHNGESDGENRLLNATKNNIRFKSSNNIESDYCEILTKAEFYSLNETEKHKFLISYLKECELANVVPKTSGNWKDFIILSTVPPNDQI